MSGNTLHHIGPNLPTTAQLAPTIPIVAPGLYWPANIEPVLTCVCGSVYRQSVFGAVCPDCGRPAMTKIGRAAA